MLRSFCLSVITTSLMSTLNVFLSVHFSRMVKQQLLPSFPLIGLNLSYQSTSVDTSVYYVSLFILIVTWTSHRMLYCTTSNSISSACIFHTLYFSYILLSSTCDSCSPMLQYVYTSSIHSFPSIRPISYIIAKAYNKPVDSFIHASKSYNHNSWQFLTYN